MAKYSVGEWYGDEATTLDSAAFAERADYACRHDSGDISNEELTAICPFDPRHQVCTKKGGVCSIRPYTELETGVLSFGLNALVTSCPVRFLKDFELLRWVGKTMLETENLIAVPEVPFLKSKSGSSAGRIDWILIDAADHSKLCALETQSLYFSGKAMGPEFARLKAKGELVTPINQRRPDYRSGGPKRLTPQLQAKVPSLRAWGIKMAVLVDDYFVEQMSPLPLPTGSTAQDNLAAAEIVWFSAKYKDNHLAPDKVQYASLTESVASLQAATEMTRSEFFESLTTSLDAAPGKERFFNL